MKRLVPCFVVLSLVLLTSVNAHSEELVAPLIEIRSDLADVYEIPEEMVGELISEMESRIPTRKQVGVPVPDGVSSIGGGHIQEMEFVNLVSPKKPDKIIAFYEEMLNEMPGWQWCGEFEVFHKSDEPLTLQSVMSFTIPIIEIKDLSSDDPLLITVDPDVKDTLNSLLKITYSVN